MPSPRPRRRTLPLVAVVVVLAAGTVGPADAAPTPATASGTTVLVQLAEGTDDVAAVAQQAAGRSGQVEEVYDQVVQGFTATLSASAVQALREDPAVLSVEPDRTVQVFGTQSPPPSWGLDRVDQPQRRRSRSFSWTSDGQGVVAYVVDSGIRADHTEFTGRLRPGFTALADGLGTGDCNGHGTHVAGTLGGTRYGVAKGVTLVPVRVLDCEGFGTYSEILAGLDHVAADHVAGSPAVVNLSLGGPTSAIIDAAVQSLVDDGIVVVAAAGNSGTDACRSSPGRVRTALTVGATTMKDTRAPYSNFGPCLDLFAPGSAVVSASVKGTTATATFSGTSMAAPHVAGAAAQLLSAQPTLTPAAVADALLRTATPRVVKDARAGSPVLLLRTPG